MDSQYSWKRTQETEIDLADLLRRLCAQWKGIVICAVVFAAVLGGYAWLRSRDSPKEDLPASEEMADLTEAEEQGVEDAVRLEGEIRDLEAYLDNSVLMQIDPYHKSRVVMLYCISHVKRQELQAVTESYINFVLNGGAADELLESGRGWKMDKSCMAELISAYQKTYSYPYQFAADHLSDDSGTLESLFCIEITGKNAKAAQKLAKDIQNVLSEYSTEAKKAVGSHRLMLVSSVESMTVDSGLQAQQHDKKSLLSSSRTSLKAMTDVFNKKQLAVYRETVGAEDEEEESREETGETGSDESFKSVLKHILAGFAGGLFVYCGIFACWYLFHDTVKSVEEMRRMYTFPVYGKLPLQKEAGKKQEACRDAYEQGKKQVMNRIWLSCKKKKLTGIGVVSGFSFSGREKECLQSIAEQLQVREIDMAIMENAETDTDAWNEMAEIGVILIVCRIGTTTRRMIDDSMNFYMENGISVAGAIVF